MAQSLIGGFLLGIIGLFLLINPRGVWKAAEKWKTLGGMDASPTFMAVMRIVGGVTFAIGLLVCLGILK